MSESSQPHLSEIWEKNQQQCSIIDQ